MFDRRSGEPAAEGHPALRILAIYAPAQEDPAWVSPYIVNLMALDQLAKTGPDRLLESYIDWYFGRLNYPDKYGCTGSIYDRMVGRDGSEKSLAECDSLDSYAATFLMLLERFWRQGGGDRAIKRHRRELRDIAYLILYLQQENGLSLALPDRSEQYLMDNCECLGGLVAYARLAETFDPAMADTYRLRAEKLRADIRRLFFNQARREYAWEIDNGKAHGSNWQRFYPDAYAQLFPILYGATRDRAERSFLWKRFRQNHRHKIPALPVEQRIVVKWTEEVMSNENHDHPGNPSRSD